MTSLADQARTLLAEQGRSWTFLRDNLQAMARFEVGVFDFGRFVVKIQFNPVRIGSVSAKVDEESIRKRPCFLCDANRPPEQKGLDCGEGYKLLCNPFPIIQDHLTIVQTEHRPQRVLDCFGTLLRMARTLGETFTVFYNGPQCGASAPDHLHLQAGTRGFMPIDNDYNVMKRLLGEREGVRAFVGEGYLRPFISFESDDSVRLERAFRDFHDRYHTFQPHALEPLMNVICTFQDEAWRVVIFPRHKHRPAFFFADDHTRMMLSPGSVDMSGIVVMPVEADFRRVNKEHLAAMYEQVSVAPELLLKILPFRPGAI